MIPVELIRQKDYPAIVDWALALKEKDRLAVLKALQETDYHPLFSGEDAHDAFSLSKVVCARNYTEQKLFPIHWPKNQTKLHELLGSSNSSVHHALLTYFSHTAPDYLDSIIKDLLLATYTYPDFRLIWSFYQHGWIKFNEESFVNILFYAGRYMHNPRDDIAWLRENPQVIEKLIIPFPQYEVPVLLRSHFYQADNSPYGGILTEFWDEMFKQLMAENLLPRQLIKELLASLTNNFKKARLDWHIRLVNMFNPQKDEWIDNQQLLFSGLNASNNSVVNFVIQTIQTLYTHPEFDHSSFMQCFPVISGREKCDKSLLIALDIAETLAERYPQYRTTLAQNVSGTLIQRTEKLQLRTAELMLKYQPTQDVAALTEPWLGGLKHSVLALLQCDSPLDESHVIPMLQHEQVIVPENWDALLFQTGKMLENKEALDIELFYAGIIALQDELPAGYKKQLQPYYKKLHKKYLGSSILYSLRDFFQQWLNDEYASMPERYERRLPHLQNQNQLVLSRLRDNCHLTLLATPSHTPFYVSPRILVERLLAHERENYPVDVDDLIIACNRILPGEVTAEVKQQAFMLTGKYAQAVQYLLRITDDISATNDEFLPLWTQITRTRNTNGVFPQYESIAKEQASWPGIAQPFTCTYRILIDKNEYKTWYKLALNNRVPYYWERKSLHPYPGHYYYMSLCRDECCHWKDVLYYLSLVPNYPDSWLNFFIPATASGNEVDGFEECLYPLQYLLENQLRVHHAGWVYIAVCLLFEKKISRDLAAEYIQLAIQHNFVDSLYLSECIAYLLMYKYAPVNRFIEYLDNHNGDPAIRRFQKQILENCITLAGEKDLPTNYKKLIAYLNEFIIQGCER
ncbi:DUF6493 family protein [Escherichia albertii]|nr:DUF6493 family protein [Escherichia albertii]MCZ8847507.1 DUF6493 family protein [Escherichia albertii]